MRKINLVIVPYNDFLKGRIYGFRSRDQHLFLEIVKDERIDKVVIVERPRSMLNFFQALKFKISGGEKSVVNVSGLGEKIFIFEFFTVGLEQVKLKHLWFDKVYGSEKFIEKFHDLLKQLGFADFSVISFNPFANKFVEAIKPKVFAFDVMDNFCFHPEFKNLNKYIFESFEWISSKSDLIFCVNENIKNFFLENYPLSNGKIFVLPNGVDENLNFDGVIPEDIRKIKNPRIGYVGVISDRIDFELVERIAKERKNYNFIFVGGKYGNVSRMIRKLKRNQNIYFIGDKHYSDLSRYIGSFDVCIVPHKVNEFTLSNDPMKIYEYIYLGKPIVATKISIQSRLVDSVFIAGDEMEFLKYLDMGVELAKDENFVKRQRETIKSDMFWREKARFIVDEIYARQNLMCEG